MRLMSRKHPKYFRFDLHKAMFILPNLFTISSIFCGFYAAVTAASAVGPDDKNKLILASAAVFFAMVFDSLDGRVARMTRTQSEFGVQMDSLADAISFGISPALIAWHFGVSEYGTLGMLACFCYAVCGVIRLARFNVMAAVSHGPSPFFVGLPIPGGAGIVSAAIMATLTVGGTAASLGIAAPIALVVIGLLMVSTVPFRTFKTARLNAPMICLLVATIVMMVIVTWQWNFAITLCVLMGIYTTMGLIEGAIHFNRWRKRMIAEAENEASDSPKASAPDEAEELIDIPADISSERDDTDLDDEDELLD